MELQVIDAQGKSASTVSASDDVFGREYNEALVHQVVVAYQANGRGGNRAQKTRAEVRHSTKKPWKQKGTGRARQGSLRSPQFRGGGAVFGPVVRSHEHDLNKKVRKLGLKTALSSKLKDGKLIVLDSSTLKSAKTSALAKAVAKLGWASALIIDGPEVNAHLKRAAANIPGLDVLPQQGANVYDILRRDTLVLTKDAVQHLEARLK